MLFTLLLVVHCEFWEFESSVLTITPGKTQHSSLALCWWQPSVASVFLYDPLKNSHWVERPPFLLPHHTIDDWIQYLFHEIKKESLTIDFWRTSLPPVSGLPVTQLWSLRGIPIVRSHKKSHSWLFTNKYRENTVSPPLIIALLPCITLWTILQGGKKKWQISFSVFIRPDDGRELKDPADDVGKHANIHILTMKLPCSFIRCKINSSSCLICKTLNALSWHSWKEAEGRGLGDLPEGQAWGEASRDCCAALCVGGVVYRGTRSSWGLISVQIWTLSVTQSSLLTT